MAKGASAALMRSKIWDKPEKMLRCREAIRRVELPLSDAYVLDRIVLTQIELTLAEEERYRKLEREHGKEVQDMVITWEDALAEQRAEGRTEGVLEAIILLAKHLHGQLPDCFEEKLEAVDDLSRLHGILEQVTAVRSLEELDLLVESRRQDPLYRSPLPVPLRQDPRRPDDGVMAEARDRFGMQP